MLAYKILTLTCLFTMPDLLILLNVFIVTIITMVFSKILWEYPLKKERIGIGIVGIEIIRKELERVSIERQASVLPTWQRNADHCRLHPQTMA